ncbi:MAG: alpha/beta fold hydrolase [Blastocatellia bacterium]|nr:alpha/beta fold hydrolase [Blastocatellia bacterium]
MKRPEPDNVIASPANDRRALSSWRRWSRRLLVAYLILLAVSHIARWSTDEPRFQECCMATLQTVDGDRTLAKTIRLAYQDFHSDAGAASLPIVLIHGSPGEAANFRRLIDELPANRLIVPDLPGFGASTRELPDYSFKAHAKYLLALLDQLKIERAHILGFSMGGGVALHMAEMAPARIASITMLAAIGVQEMELLGDYRMNHAVHGAQLALFWLLREGVPRTPASYRADASVSYSRNFYDSDQRPLRGILARYEGPMRIIHGRGDFLVPVEAAIEHHRLAPQSELILSDFDHFMVFDRPGYLGPLVTEFLARVESGAALTRAQADPARIVAAGRALDPKSLPRFIGVTAFVVVLLLAAATLVSEDLTCIGAGVIAAQGRMSFALAAFACFLGIFVGDLLLFLAGRWLGRVALARAPLRWFVREADVRRSSEWFSRRGAGVIFASRFLPGARLPTYFAAGALRTSFWKFTLYFLIACAVWTPLLVGLAMWLGQEVLESALLGGQSLLVKLVIVVVLASLLARLSIRLSTWKGRRLLLSSWRRLTRWEFWPMWAFYPPVLVYIAWLMIRHRSLTLFTASNPAIPGGGFVGESKSEILRGLEKASDFIPRWTLLRAADPPAARIDAAARFLAAAGIGFPVVLKPDAGERGAGVVIAKSRDEIDACLREAKVDMLLQEYAPGDEFGVFYYRFPDEPRGKIFAITEKRFPTVTGDGVSTLERLILQDDRAVCVARLLLDSLADRLWEIPAAGEIVQLVEVGAHARGTLFLDGGRLRTDALERAIDEVCRGYEGFYFGRFDLRTPDLDAFREGREFRIIELNGVTSEATSIYDPKNSVIIAWRTLFAQWRIAFEIGARNRRNGAQVTSARQLLQWLREHQDQA